jgi:site-specific recombinase XerD
MGINRLEHWKSKRHGGSSQIAVTPRKHYISIFEALQGFIRYQRDERQASPFTLDAYERDLLHFATSREAAGTDLDLASVTADDMRGHMHAMIDRHLANATVRRAMYALGSFFGWAVRWELVPSNPVLRVIVPRRERVREVRALTKRERAVLVAAADRLAAKSRRVLNRQAPLFVRLMLKTGLRRSEVIALTWRDVDLDTGELLVRHGKGDKSRRVPIEDKDLLTRLRTARVEREIDAPGNDAALATPVFISTRGMKLARTSFYRLFHRVLKHAELAGRGITPHALRHTFGSMLCAKGVPVPYVKDLLGHEDIGSTMVYVHTTPLALRQAVRTLGE